MSEMTTSTLTYLLSYEDDQDLKISISSRDQI